MYNSSECKALPGYNERPPPDLLAGVSLKPTSLLKQEAVGAHIRELRLAAHMSLRSLAARTDFSPSFISQVENGLVSPSINSMQKIAEALGVTLGEFFAAAAHGKGGTIVRVANRQTLSSSWSQAVVESLAPMDSHHPLEAILITLEPAGRSGKHPYPRPCDEFALVLEGEATLTLGPETQVMEAGDAVVILPRELRLWVNDGSSRARILVVSVRDVGGPRTAAPRAPASD
jgi:transcriptional regulator with XRE-family HTH domain